MSNFKDNIINLIDNYYINWDPCFSSDIIDIINRNSQQNIDGYRDNNTKKFYYDLKKVCNKNFESLLKIVLSSSDFEYIYNFKGIIGNGSCGSIMLYDKLKLNGEIIGEYAFKFSFNGEADTSRNESTIHYIINNFQNNSNNLQIVPKLDLILLTKNEYFHIMMEKLNFDLSSFFKKYNPFEKIFFNKNLGICKDSPNFKYWNIYLEFLYQFSSKLILLQDNFKFMHNDLKCNNILVKESLLNNKLDYSSLEFLLCDFGGSSYTYDDKKYEGTILGSSSEFNVCKDVFQLIHMQLSFSSHRINLIKFIKYFNIFKLNGNLISTKREKWIKTYTYSEDGNTINECYNPRILKEKLITISNYIP